MCRSLFAIPLALILFTPFVCAQDNIIELTNADVLAMVRDKVSSDAIITKIQTSRCHFDTFPMVISELRYRGVPEEILVAMVEAPVGRATKQVEDVNAKRPATGSVTAPPVQKSPAGSATKPTTPASVAPPEKTTSGSLKVAPTGTATGPRKDSAKSGSRTAALRKETATVPREKTAAESVTTGKASMPTVKVTPPKQSVTGAAATTQQTPAGPLSVAPTQKSTIKSAPPTPKQNDATKSAALPLPEPARPESGIAANSAIRQPTGTSSTNSVTPVKTEKRAPESAGAATTKQSVEAPTPPPLLTNYDVIKLLRSGSPSTAVVAAIKAAAGNYDLSAKALAELQEAGADATVFLSMMETSQRASDEKTAGSGTNGTSSLQNKKP